MTTKAATNPQPADSDQPDLGEIDAFVERNREELNASIRRARSELANGARAARTISEIVAEGRKRHGAS